MAVQIDKQRGRSRSERAGAAAVEMTSNPHLAWSAYKPNAKRPWNLAQAAHLYRRATFGASWGQLQQALSDGPQQSVGKLLRPQGEIAAFNREYDEYEASAAGSIGALSAWWLRRMILTPHPLLEKMTLFWHSHFAANGAKVKIARLMQQHTQLLRSQALGSFGTLLQGVTRDPAVLLSLGAEANRKAQPNQYLARTFLEAFTIGPGNCTDQDVRETAKAFTGWFVLRGNLRHIPRECDGNSKEILGQKGNFTGDDVVRIVLEQQATAQTLVRKLYRWLICETEAPDAKLINPLAESFAKDYDILKLVETMLRSNLFFSQAAYRRRIKCPVEFALGIVRAHEAVVSTTQLAQDVAELGQNLYHPPTAKGWTGGRHWINNATLVGRYNLATAMLQGSGPYGNKLNPQLLAGRHGASTSESAAKFLVELLLQDDLDPAVRKDVLKTAEASAAGDQEAVLRRFVHTVVTLPEFQLA